VKLVVKECGEPAHGTAEYAIVVEAWLETLPPREHVQRVVDQLNELLTQRDGIPR
jgi:hypothetical protein